MAEVVAKGEGIFEAIEGQRIILIRPAEGEEIWPLSAALKDHIGTGYARASKEGIVVNKPPSWYAITEEGAEITLLTENSISLILLLRPDGWKIIRTHIPIIS